MKLFAMFLPQVHEIPENNEWWGERFTEWTKIKSAKALYRGHEQPVVPLEGYYNLLDRSTVEWQTRLMNKFGVDGLVYYHYYFTGRLLLEKPAENLLKWNDIDQKFFFCWANHSWTRSWEKSKVKLIEQTYGDVNDWEKHFQYLLKFFVDDRYEKVDNKPVLMIYDITFKEYAEMMDYFCERCCDYGFSGMYLIERPVLENINQREMSDQVMIDRHTHFREPAYTLRAMIEEKRHSFSGMGRMVQKEFARIGAKSCIEKINGEEIYHRMIARKYASSDIPGIFFSWDSTPRHGRDGYIISPPDYETFVKYMNKISSSQYALINAWNEWSEGMILEPTKKHGYRFLEWIRNWRENIDSI